MNSSLGEKLSGSLAFLAGRAAHPRNGVIVSSASGSSRPSRLQYEVLGGQCYFNLGQPGGPSVLRALKDQLVS